MSLKPTVQGVIRKYEMDRVNRRNQFTFDELQKLSIGENREDFPDPLDQVLERSVRRRNVQNVWDLIMRYSNRCVRDIRISIRDFENERRTARMQQQRRRALPANATMEPIPLGLPMNQPRQYGFNRGFGYQNLFAPLSGNQWTGPTAGNTAAPGPAMYDQKAQNNGTAVNPLPASFDAGIVAPVENSAAVAVNNELDSGDFDPSVSISLDEFDSFSDWNFQLPGPTLTPKVLSDHRLTPPALTPDMPPGPELRHPALVPETTPDSQLAPAEHINDEQFFDNPFLPYFPTDTLSSVGDEL
ncbi:hypothetical protein P171DRAFT_437067 [Karstenula rhodostoma CBS 690.94]|uniref:Uncharacterized protein n=1 Tax=Karstenula rhodostoma CBS 690.94 TaxID=1392251 RepID=A0A9P4P8R8_9PLEO|nr:hypothetical protein P171DRAFT_437067 [Karstenula rhodostoma CBS 690.94]